MRLRYLIIAGCLIFICTANQTITARSLTARTGQVGEEQAIKLSKKLHYVTIVEARNELMERLLMPPANLGAKRDDVHRKFGKPKEIFGYGNEVFNTKEAMISVLYTTNEKGDVVVSSIEYRPKQELAWNIWLKPAIQLPTRPNGYDKKTPVQLTTQIRIDDIGENKSMQITMIGSEYRVSFINWSLVL